MTQLEPSPTRTPASAPPRPALLFVDDDPGVARAVQRDLRGRYGDRYQVVGANSAADALDLVDRLALRNQPVALLLADQRMPQMNGVEFLEQAMRRVPDAKRVLLTAYADTEAAIKAINDINLDYYLRKPWEPPEDNLFPVLDGLLDDWKAGTLAGADAVRLIGHRWSKESHGMRDFLGRNLVPFRWVDVERDTEADRLLTAAGLTADALPVLVFPDGETLSRPTFVAVAEKIGLATRAEKRFYDLVIVGGGPAGLAAAVYGASEGLDTVLLEREATGGQAGQSSRIENYLGFPVGLSGADLTRRAGDQARRFGAEVLSVSEAAGIEARGPARIVRLADGSEVAAHAVIVATGVSYRRLDVPGEERLSGRGLYYGAARSEASACKDEDIVVVGGANSAGQAAMYFAGFARRVTILYRGADLRKSMSSYLIDQIAGTPTITVETGAQVTALHGDDHLEAITVAGRDGERRVEAQGVFVFIGASPRTDWVGSAIARDRRGFILSGPDVLGPEADAVRWPLDRDPYLLETSLPGVFVAGDVRHQSIKRVASAVGDGSMSVQFVHQYLGDLP